MEWAAAILAFGIAVGCFVIGWREARRVELFAETISNPSQRLASESGRQAASQASAEEAPTLDLSRPTLASELVASAELAVAAQQGETFRERVLASNELVGLAKIERERARRLPTALARICFFTGGACALVGLSVQLSSGAGWQAALASFGAGGIGGVACAGLGRQARARAVRLVEVVSARKDEVEASRE